MKYRKRKGGERKEKQVQKTEREGEKRKER